jgi:hypothetical protein
MMCEKPLTALLAPLALVVPLATLAAVISEMEFARRWSRRLRPKASRRLRSRRLSSITAVAEEFA